MKKKWSIAQINDWYDNHPWIRGCNFMSSDCANRIDQWQAYEFDKRLKTADRELALARDIGFNSVRLIMDFYVWQDEHDSYMANLERYLQTTAKNGISAMIVMANDCLVPKEDFIRPQMGPQHVDWGYHGGSKRSPHRRLNGMGWSPLDEPELREQFYQMVTEIIGKYANDERVIFWNIMNEPGNAGRGEQTVPRLKELFTIARELDPCQPLTAECWSNAAKPLPAEKVGLMESDIISYHDYNEFDWSIRTLDILREFKRPILNTEWLCRPQGNTIQQLFPLFYLERIGCYNWGFVAGKYQTYEPHEAVWQAYERGDNIKWDFTKWMHDLFRPCLRPYDPIEIETIRKFCKLADEKWERRNSKRK